jgi:hypothetical protein
MTVTLTPYQSDRIIMYTNRIYKFTFNALGYMLHISIVIKKIETRYNLIGD